MNKFSRKMVLLLGVTAAGLIISFRKQSKKHEAEGKEILEVLEKHLGESEE